MCKSENGRFAFGRCDNLTAVHAWGRRARRDAIYGSGDRCSQLLPYGCMRVLVWYKIVCQCHNFERFDRVTAVLGFW